MKKINIFCIIIFIFVLILSCNVFSFNTYTNWGNAKNTSSCPYWLWSSCYPQSNLNLNFTEIQISQTSDFSPLVMYSMVDKFDPLFQKRFIYTFSGTSLNIYDASDGSLYSSSTLDGKFISKPNFLRLPDVVMVSYGLNTGYLLYGIMNISGNYSTVRLYMNDNKEIKTYEHETLNTNTIVYYATNYLTENDFIPALLSNGTLNFYTIDGTYYGHYDLNITLDSNMLFSSDENSNPILFEDINNDGYNDVVGSIPYTYSDATYKYIKLKYFAFDLQHGTILIPETNINITKAIVATTPIFRIFQNNNAIIRYGSSSSSNKLYTYMRIDREQSSNGVKQNQTFNSIISSSGTVLYNDFTDNPSIINSNFVFTDVNYDNNIEACSNKQGNLTCYNSVLTKIINIAGLSNSYYFSLGKFTNNSYMSIILKDTMYNFNTTNIWNIKNFTNYEEMSSIPLSLFTKTNYSNDIIGFGTNNIYLRLIESISYVCGDGVCSVYENPLTCYDDCFDNNAIPSTLLNTNDPCQSNTDCLSGLCFLYKCQLKNKNVACSSNSECLSGSCIQGFCKDSGLGNEVTQYKNNIFGSDDASGIIVFGIISLIIFILCAVISVKINNIIPLILGLILVIIFMVSLTLLGWLTPWILLIVIILLLLMAVASFLFFGNLGS